MRLFYYCFLIGFCCCTLAAALTPLILEPKQSLPILPRQTQVLEDPHGELSFQEILQPECQAAFQAHHGATLTFGRSPAVFWVHFVLRHPEPRQALEKPQPWVLSNEWKRIHQLDLYCRKADAAETPWTHLVGGMNSIVQHPDNIHAHLSVFPLLLEPGQNYDAYLRVESDALLFLPLRLESGPYFLQRNQQQHLLYGLFYGILFTIALLNLLLYPSSNDKAYIWYAVHLFFLALSFMEFNLFVVSKAFVPFNARSDSVYFALLFLSLAALSMFTKDFLRPKEKANLASVDYGFTLLTSLHLIGVACCLLAPFKIALVYLLGVWALSGLAYTLLPVLSWRHTHLEARLFLINWAILTVFCLRCLLVHLTLIPPTMTAFHSVQMGVIAHALLFSFALMIRDYRRNKVAHAEQVHTRSILEETEARFTRLLEHAPDIIYRLRFSPEQRFEYVSEAITHILGYSPADFYQNPFLPDEIAHPEDQDRIHVLETTKETDARYEFISRWRHKNGHDVWIEQRWAPILDKAGQLLAIEGIARDISAQKEADAALRERERRLAEAERIAHIGWWDQNLVNKKLQWSEEVYRIFGVDPEAFPQTQDAFFSMVHPEDRSRLIQLTKECLAQKADWDVDHRIIQPDGAIRYVHEKAAITFDAEGEAVRMLGTVQDITDRVLAAQRQKELESEVQQAEKMRSLGLMAGGIAHDFNNLLTGVLAHTEQLQKKLPREDSLYSRTEAIHKAGRHMAEMSKQLLAYAGKRPQQKEITHLNAAARQASDMLSDLLPQHPIIEMRLQQDLPPILADPAQLRQILINLMANAAESMESHTGNILVTTGLMRCDRLFLEDAIAGKDKDPGNYCYCKVIDAGCGIAEENLRRIFDPFFTTKNANQGLGLATVIGAVRAHQAVLKVSSVPEHGSIFTLLFPVAETTKETAPQPLPETPAANGAQPMYQGKVLVVDDFDDILDLLSDILEQYGFTVESTTSPSQALDWITKEEKRFDLIIADQTMPEMTGLQLLDALRASGTPPRFILCSGYSEYDIQALQDQEGPDAFLMKPFDEKELLRILDQVYF